MKFINHPLDFKMGWRVIQLVGRPKDNVEKRNISRISHDIISFNKILLEFEKLSVPGERIYSTASPRDINKAIKNFKRAQLEADLINDVSFYEKLHSRWISALSQPDAALKEHKLWMFDIDSDDDFDLFHKNKPFDIEIVYKYYTKNGGSHYLVEPYDKLQLIPLESLLDTNPLMLWAY